jgi:quercetin dioxygenase-like cupin family protein
MSALRAYRPKNPKELMMKHLSQLILFALVLIPIGTLSQSNSAQSPVEISGEPRHHPKFENEFVRVLDVTVPAGDATLWHVHRKDNVVITLGSANLRIETVGADTAEVLWKLGDVNFRKATYVHRAINIGTTPFHNLTIELLKSPAGSPEVSSPKGTTARQPLLENDRVRVYRVALEPGQSTTVHTHSLPGLAVSIMTSEIEVTTKGKATPNRLTLPAGDVRWRGGSVTHSIKNVGQTPFVGVDIELK